MNDDLQGLSDDELGAHSATALPDKEVVSILDLNADINLAVDTAAPVDLAVAANANVAAPIDGAVGANVLSIGSTAQALDHQGVEINQGLNADATAHATQASGLDQTAGATTPAASAGGADGISDPVAGAAGAATDPSSGAAGTVGDVAGGAAGTAGDAVGGVTAGDLGGAAGSATDAAGGALNGNLLNVDVNVDANAHVAAPINGAVAANANVAAPIDASVGANVGSVNSDAVAVSQQDAIINQDITGSADATSDQQSTIQQ